ncbi:hypothetical protein J7E32_00560 [Bacillus sp. ISL-55]|nr:hypothetical protein [Bacillus sp. ISL-55]
MTAFQVQRPNLSRFLRFLDSFSEEDHKAVKNHQVILVSALALNGSKTAASYGSCCRWDDFIRLAVRHLD